MPAAGLEEVAALRQRLTGADGAAHLNELAHFYDLAESKDLHVVAEALKAIPCVLAHHRHRCQAAVGTDDKSAEVLKWLQGHGEAYFSALVQLAISKSARAQACGLRLAFAAIQDEEIMRVSASGTAAPPPPENRVQTLLTEVLLAEHWNDQVAECLMGEFVARYVDLRHYVLRHLRSCAEETGKVVAMETSDKAGASADAAGERSDGQAEPMAKRRRRTLGRGMYIGYFAEVMLERKVSPETFFVRALACLREAPAPTGVAGGTDGAMDGDADGEAAEKEAQMSAPAGRPARFFLREYRKLFQNAWLQLLSLRVPLEQCQTILQLVPTLVIPHMSSPLMLADFYLQAFHCGSREVSVLSLSGLFLLLTKYGLGDPESLSSSCGEYYARLFELLSLDTLKLQSRVRFQRLLTASLLSGLLPARYAAAFAKKCMRLAIASSDHGTTMWLVSVAYTLIQRHHSHCRSLLHRPGVEQVAEAADAKATEPAEEADPFDTGAPLAVAADQARRSSLWELQALERHYLPTIRTLVNLFKKPFFKPSAKKLDPELFLDQSASKMYAQALKTSERQLARWAAKGQQCPVAFKLEDDELCLRLAGWAATLSTSQRKLGANI